jgi:ribosomal protein S18 acetylase RimI-like enzyme
VPAAAALAQAAGALASGRPFICKTCDPLTRAVFGQQFDLQPARAFVSYTAARVLDAPPDPDVVISATLDPRCAALATRTPYSPAELAYYLADGGLTFTLFEEDATVCMCLIYRNFEDIWEIAGLHTLPQARRHGYARRVVLAALAAIQARGGTPRYVIERTNTASMRLAESLGLTAFLTVEHDWSRTR